MGMKVMTMVDALNNAMDIKLGDDRNVVVYGEDVGVEGGVFRVTEGLQKKYGEERVFDSPLAESAICWICCRNGYCRIKSLLLKCSLTDFHILH